MEWKEIFGVDTRRTVQQVISAALVNSDLHSALVAVAGNNSGLLISSERLGRWLHKVEGKIVSDLRLIRDKRDHGGHWLWKLQSS
jgi:hypothetical protein